MRSGSVRAFGRGADVRATILRIPGIYAPDRAGGTPRERLLKGTPALAPEIDVYTNHIHADDLARACLAALWRGKPQRIVNVERRQRSAHGRILRPGRRSVRPAAAAAARRRCGALQQLTPMQRSFMSESRRLSNQRMKRELRLVLRYPTVLHGLAVVAPTNYGFDSRQGFDARAHAACLV